MLLASRDRRRRSAAAAVGTALLCFTAPVATAATGSPSPSVTATFPAADEDGPGKLVLVMDSSGSMKERTPTGGTRIAAAKKALRTVIPNLPPDQEVGLRVFGATVFSRTDPGACEDSQLVVPLGADNRKELTAQVDGYQPYGETPISHALREAAKDLGSDGVRNIVLVSDGEPTCPPDPCEVAKEIRSQGISLRIDVVGLDVDASARTSLECIATSGGGDYYDAADADELTDALSHLAERSARAYTPTGTLVEGSDAAADAPEVSAGDWIDVNPTPGVEQFYEVKRRFKDSTITVGAAITSADTAAGGTSQVRLITASDDSCDLKTGLGALAKPITAVAKSSQYDKDECLDAESLIVGVTYNRAAVGAPIELAIRETPSADPLPAKAQPTATWTAPDGAVQPTAGGTSFTDQTPLAPGRYSSTIVPGEFVTFSVDLDYGQSLSAQLDVAQLKGALGRVGGRAPQLNLYVYSPSRIEVTSADGAPADDFSLLIESGAKASVLANAVDFATLDNSNWATFEPGTYTVAVGLTKVSPSYAVPFTLGIGVADSGIEAPTFSEVPYDSAPPSPNGETSDAPEAGTGAPKDIDAKAGDDDGISPAVVGVGGLGVLALAAAGVVFLRSRRAH